MTWDGLTTADSDELYSHPATRLDGLFPDSFLIAKLEDEEIEALKRTDGQTSKDKAKCERTQLMYA